MRVCFLDANSLPESTAHGLVSLVVSLEFLVLAEMITSVLTSILDQHVRCILLSNEPALTRRFRTFFFPKPLMDKRIIQTSKSQTVVVESRIECLLMTTDQSRARCSVLALLRGRVY